MQAQQIIDHVTTILIDEATVRRWSDAELIDYINSAQRQIVFHKPEAGAVVNPARLVPDVVVNMGSNGETPGRSISLINREDLDLFDRTWRTTDESATIKYYMYDHRVPKTYYVYPPADGTSYVEIQYSALPTVINDVEDVLDLIDIYQESIISYVLFKAYAKDSTNSSEAAMRAADYLNLFRSQLGIKADVDSKINPQMNVFPVIVG